MIRYRWLYESENSDIKLYDTVKCAGYEWFVIKIEGDIASLLAKDDDFGKSRFEKKKPHCSSTENDYESSEIRNYLNNSVLPKLQNANPIPTRLDDVGCTDKVWLLSFDEARRLPKKIRQFPRWYWLRSPGSYIDIASLVDNVGNVDWDGGSVSSSGSVRPAMRVRVEDLD